jgi:hypothetical protein
MSAPTETWEQWLAFVFDNPVDDPAWHWDGEHDPSDGPAEVTVARLTRLFEGPAESLAPFSDAQISQGLWYLADNACSNHMFAVASESVPMDDRVACLRGMLGLFGKLFAPRCTPHLCHRGEEGAGPVNLVCYMWWDLLPIIGEPENVELAPFDAAALDVMIRTLELESDACREAALHGLGHWHDDYPGVVADTIDAFLARSPALRPELREYAQNAREGLVQ